MNLEYIPKKTESKEGNNESDFLVDEAFELSEGKECISQKIRVIQLYFLENLSKNKYGFNKKYNSINGTFSELFAKRITVDAHNIDRIRESHYKDDVKGFSPGELWNFLVNNIEIKYEKGGVKEVDIFLDKLYEKSDFGEMESLENNNQLIIYEDFSKIESVLDIHVNSGFISSDNNIGLLEITESFKELAEKIVEDHKFIEKVKGESWLFDSKPILRRIGFREVERKKFDIENCSLSVYGQFLDSNGNLKKNEVKKFLKTGDTPRDVVVAEIDIADFLHKYLPEKRGERVTFEKVNEYTEKEIEKSKLIFKSITEDFEGLSLNDILEKLSKLVLWDYVAGNGSIGEDFKSVLIASKKNNLSFRDMKSNNLDLFKKIDEIYLSGVEELKKDNMETIYIDIPD